MLGKKQMYFHVTAALLILSTCCYSLDTQLPLVDLNCLGTKATLCGPIFIKTKSMVEPENVELVLEDGLIRDINVCIKGKNGQTDESITQILLGLYPSFVREDAFSLRAKDHSVSIFVTAISSYTEGDNYGYKISIQKLTKKTIELQNK